MGEHSLKIFVHMKTDLVGDISHKVFFCRRYPDELVEEPLLFTKESKVVQPYVTFEEQRTMQQGRPTLVTEGPPLSSASKITPRPRKLLSMKQAVVEKIYDHAERFDYFQKGLKHHLARKEGWRVVERYVCNQIPLKA